MASLRLSWPLVLLELIFGMVLPAAVELHEHTLDVCEGSTSTTRSSAYSIWASSVKSRFFKLKDIIARKSENRGFWDNVASQTFRQESLILNSDRDQQKRKEVHELQQEVQVENIRLG